MQSKKPVLLMGLTLSVLTGLVLLSLSSIRAPRPLSSDAPPQVFSAERARVHLEQIARVPHPIGSAAEREVGKSIADAITQMGIKPQIERKSVLVHPSPGDFVAGQVTNIFAVLPGTDNTGAVLLVAHYDSVASSFGASDDGNGVAVLLETLRALRSGAPLRNDVIFLFTDGEEAGSLGAHAFLQDHALGQKVALVLNFEARGTSGAAFLFETSSNNGWMIREFAKVAPNPAASSLFYEIYKRLPNDTDLSAFKKAGFAGMNFAYSGNQLFYHTADDNLSHLDTGSLQQQGSYGTSLARGFGDLDLERVARGNVIYFSLWRSFLLWYPESWAVPLAVLVLLAALALTYAGLKTNNLRPSALIAALVKFPLACLACGLSSTALWWLVRSVQPQYRAFLPSQGDIYNHGWYMFAVAALSIAIMAAAFLRRREQVSAWDLLSGVIIVLSVANLCVALLAPGASYLLTWPLIFTVVLLSAVFAKSEWRRFGASGARTPSISLEFMMLLCCAPAVIVLVPLSLYLFVGFGMQAAGLSALVFAVLVGLIAPLLAAIPSRPLLLSSLIALLALLVGGSLTSAFNPQHPKQNAIFYALDANSGKAVWANRQSQQDPWTAQYLGSHPRKTLLPYVSPSHRVLFATSTAPSLKVPPPEAIVLGDTRTDNTRHLRLLIKSMRGASNVLLYPEKPVMLYSLELGGDEPSLVSVSTSPRRASRFDVLMIRALPAEGIVLSMNLPADTQLHFHLVDKTEGLPAIPDMSFKPRASWMLRSRELDFFNEATLVSRNVFP